MFLYALSSFTSYLGKAQERQRMNAIQEVLDRCVETPRPHEERAKALIALRTERSQLKAKKRKLLPIEHDAQSAIAERLLAIAVKERAFTAGTEYRRIDLAALKLRDKKGLPKIVPFTLGDSSFSIDTRQGVSLHDPQYFAGLGSTTFFLLIAACAATAICGIANIIVSGIPLLQTVIAGCLVVFVLTPLCLRSLRRKERNASLPDEIRNCYADVESMLLERERKESSNFQLSVRFTGVIPDAIREKAKKARSHFDHVLILAEPANWELKVTKADPILAGWDGKNLFLIDVFDATPLEHYITKEFTT